MNKALDYNKLKESHAQGKLLKKLPHSHYYVSIKYDGNYTTVIKEKGESAYISSGGKEYTNNKPTIFDNTKLPDGVYLCERIASDGKLGDRRGCALTGPRGNQVAVDHKYKVHQLLTKHAYDHEYSYVEFRSKYNELYKIMKGANLLHHLVESKSIPISQVDAELKRVTDLGYEGIMLKAAHWQWASTNSRTVNFMKYKRRPTADLLVVDVVMGAGKYVDRIGSLVLQDSAGRVVQVGSGMSDEDRGQGFEYFIGEIVEIFYEQIMDTYIQPTFGSESEGVTIRHDKTEEAID